MVIPILLVFTWTFRHWWAAAFLYFTFGERPWHHRGSHASQPPCLAFSPSFLCDHPVCTQHLHTSSWHIFLLTLGWVSTTPLVLMAFPGSFHDSCLLYVIHAWWWCFSQRVCFLYKLLPTHFAVKHYCQMFGKAGKEVVWGCAIGPSQESEEEVG